MNQRRATTAEAETSRAEPGPAPLSPTDVARHLEAKARTLREEADRLDQATAPTATLRRRHHAQANILRADATAITAQAWVLRARSSTNHHTRA